MSAPVKIGFIGGSGHHYLREVLDLPSADRFEVAFTSDGHDEAASRQFLSMVESTARPKPVHFRWITDANAMLDEFKPDILSIGAVYGFNGDWNRIALGRNLPIVSDKPIASTWEQFNAIEEAVKANPAKILLTEFDLRCRPAFRAARDAVAKGIIGDVVLATAQKSYRFRARPSWYADRVSYGGTLLWVASHGLDVIEFVAGKPFTRISGTQGNISRRSMPAMQDHVAVVGDLKGGGAAVAHADFLRPDATATHADDRIRVAGTQGIIEVRGDRAELLDRDGHVSDITNAAIRTPGIGITLYETARGKPSPFFSTAQSIASARMLLRARDAVEKREWLMIE
ncbi:MAG: Gfo/Idh/MocA family oxidoreductase [Phycisphaerae bacterium]|nr:Gfo/Idh/MocA family oxidoreductase [Phycisphaerae bacterium]